MSKSIPNGQVIVYRDEFQVITWNTGATFNVYFQLEEDEFSYVDCFTIYDIENEDQARIAAKEHAEFNNEILA